MTGVPAGQGFLLQLLAESFAVRALLGSLAAAALVWLLTRGDLLRSAKARQTLVLLPLVAAGVAAAASVLQETAFLPRLWVASSNPLAEGDLVDLADEARQLTLRQGVDLLLLVYLGVVGLRLGRRVVGAGALSRLLRRAAPAARDGEPYLTIRRLAATAAWRAPRVRLLPGCAGGAFACGHIRQTLVVDPLLLASLDDREREGLLAHELGHLRRRDPTRQLLVGIGHDLAFFLPPLHFAVQWLQAEQEQCADRLAATLTARPAALASSIMKVWQGASETPGKAVPVGGCAAVPALAGLGGVRWPPREYRRTTAAQLVARRVERLIGVHQPVSVLRRRVELLVVLAALVASSVVGLVVPDLVSQRWAPGLAFASIPAAPAAEGDTPVWETFRSLTAPSTVDDAAVVSPSGARVACPCVESQAQLRRAEAARPPAPQPRLLWARGELEALHLRSPSTYNSVWTSEQGGAEVGVFLLTRSSEDEWEPAPAW